jgi:hypothetical protein
VELTDEKTEGRKSRETVPFKKACYNASISLKIYFLKIFAFLLASKIMFNTFSPLREFLWQMLLSVHFARELSTGRHSDRTHYMEKFNSCHDLFNPNRGAKTTGFTRPDDEDNEGRRWCCYREIQNCEGKRPIVYVGPSVTVCCAGLTNSGSCCAAAAVVLAVAAPQ